MSCKIRTSSKFDKDLKKLSKRYSSFRLDIVELATQLAENPFMGTDLGGGARKVRMRIRSKGKGKSGGARVITYTADVVVQTLEGEIVLLTIYDKADVESISDVEIRRLIEDITQESR